MQTTSCLCHRQGWHKSRVMHGSIPHANLWLAMTVGIVVTSPLFGGPSATTQSRQALLGAVLGAVNLVAAAWMLAQYAFEVLPQIFTSTSFGHEHGIL